MYQLYQMFGPLKNGVMLTCLYSPLVLLAYGLGIWVAARFIFWLFDPKRANGWDRREILLLIPLGPLASGSMSSSGRISSILGRWASSSCFWRSVLPSSLEGGAASRHPVCLGRSADILHGHLPIQRSIRLANLRGEANVADRTWYRHPDYGPMIIDSDLLQMIQPVCEKIRDGGSDSELLSLPFSYANYFCFIRPWHGYVTTFFDISTEQTIQSLMDELQRFPPKWIFYQRQLRVLRLCEIVYNHGNPLPQRYLEQLIEQRLAKADGESSTPATSATTSICSGTTNGH